MGDGVAIRLVSTLPTHDIYNIDYDKYFIYTTVTGCGSVVENWLAEIELVHHVRLHKLVVGLGVQWKPHSSGYFSPAATIQLCVGQRCLIFQIMHADYIPQSLAIFLQESSYTFVGVWNYSDAAMLLSYGLNVSPIDLRYVAAQNYNPDCVSMSMARLASEILGMTGVEKTYCVGKSEWDEYALSEEQIKYAAVDASVSFELGKHLRVWEDNCDDSNDDDDDSNDDDDDSSYY